MKRLAELIEKEAKEAEAGQPGGLDESREAAQDAASTIADNSPGAEEADGSDAVPPEGGVSV